MGEAHDERLVDLGLADRECPELFRAGVPGWCPLPRSRRVDADSRDAWAFEGRYYGITRLSCVADPEGYGFWADDLGPAPERGTVLTAVWHGQSGARGAAGALVVQVCLAKRSLIE